MRKLAIFIVGLVMFIGSSADATVINIPADQPTIQAGIDAAINGDTILVADGIYAEHIDFLGGAVRLISENGAEMAVIEKVFDDQTIVNFSSGEDGYSVLSGFTVRNSNHAGITCDASSPVIEYCIIENNDSWYGGGIQFANNAAPIIRNNIIRGNYATHGGGLAGTDCDEYHQALIDSNYIYNNTTSNNGACFHALRASFIFTHNIVYENHAGLAGGAMRIDANGGIIENNTFCDNTAPTVAGGIFTDGNYSTDTYIRNNIFYGNSLYGFTRKEGSNFHLLYNCFFGNESGPYDDIVPEEGNIFDDPLFVDPATNDFNLTSDSPCIDAGDPVSPLDPDGSPADMGALYFMQLLGYGDLSGTVQDYLGDPISGASVGIDSLGLLYTTGPDGAYFFDNLDAPWRYDISVSHDSYIDIVVADVMVMHDDTTYADIMLNAASYIRGEVINMDYELIEGVVARVQGYEDDADTTNSVGEYFIDWITDGYHDILFFHPEYVDYLADGVEALTNDTTELNISLAYFGSVGGTVTHSGYGPISGVEVTLADYPDLADTTDEFGEYYLDRLDPGLSLIEFSHPMYVDVTDMLEVSSGDHTELNIMMIGSGVLNGVVTNALLNPIENVFVTINGHAYPESIYTNIDGEYEIPDIAPDAYDISFSRHNNIDTTVTGVVITESDTTELNVVMGQGYQYLSGDVNMYNGAWPPMVIGGDVTYLVSFMRGMPSSQRCEFDGFWCSADANGDCLVIGSDVTKLVGYFRGMGSMLWCQDYPTIWSTPDDLPPSAPPGWPNCE
ncbi:MAG: hypothetical protein GY839_06140 [candidate division Zixibacteria bacterium]|nr:hypothetical protein [candidate division Zixibacteria bacterium]